MCVQMCVIKMFVFFFPLIGYVMSNVMLQLSFFFVDLVSRKDIIRMTDTQEKP